MRKGAVIFIFLLLGVLLFIITLKRVGLEAVKEAVFMFSLPQLAFILLMLAVGAVGMGTLRWRAIMRALDAPLPRYRKLALVKLVGFSLSYLTPAALFGGEPARYFILKGEDEKKNSRLIASIVLDKMMQTLSSCLFFFAGLFLLLMYLDLSWLIDVLMIAILLAVVLLFVFLIKRIQKISKEKGFFISMFKILYLNKIKKLKEVQDKFEEVEREIRRFFRHSREAATRAVLYTFLEVIFILFVFWLIIFFMGDVLTIPRVLVIRSMTDLSIIIPFPASLGTLELTQAFVFGAFGLGAATGVALSLVFRGVSLTLAFFGLLAFVFFHIQGVINRFGKKLVKLIKLIPGQNGEKNGKNKKKIYS